MRADTSRVVALVVLWCRDDPARTGETLSIPAGGPFVFGRGDASTEQKRVGLTHQRPGAAEPTGPLLCPRISRSQLRLSRTESGLLTVESIGQCALLHDGVEKKQCSPSPGDLVELRNELLFLAVLRPPQPPRARGVTGILSVPFATADASGILGESPAIWALRAEIAAVARLDAHVLVLGPSGSGKELVARAVHRLSSRGKRPLVARNAATIPESLADAELFGNLKNYPNPGTPDRHGLVGEANGSSLFLDELGELPSAMQARLLRVLDEGEYQRLGETSARRTDLRLIAATNRPPEALKHDVLARFRTRLHVPDLNDRREDIPLLAAHLLRRHAGQDPTLAARFFPDGDLAAAPRLSPALVSALVKHVYTTHVRELDTLLVQAALESEGRYIDLTPGVRKALSARAPSDAPPPSEPLAEQGFTDTERRWLDLLRGHGFSATSAGRDPDYPGNRQTADLHLRKLICRALTLSSFSVQGAAALLAGPGARGEHKKLAARIDTFLRNLEKHMTVPPDAPPDAALLNLTHALADEWTGSLGILQQVARALHAGQIR
ncbi:MAG: sigma 54-interacting transcriptional regulator [Polyangiaceae bacterium]